MRLWTLAYVLNSLCNGQAFVPTDLYYLAKALVGDEVDYRAATVGGLKLFDPVKQVERQHRVGDVVLADLCSPEGDYSLDVLQVAMQHFVDWGEGIPPKLPFVPLNMGTSGFPGEDEWNGGGDWWKSRTALVVLYDCPFSHWLLWRYDPGAGLWWDLDSLNAAPM